MILVQLTSVSCLLVANQEYWEFVALSQVLSQDKVVIQSLVLMVAVVSSPVLSQLNVVIQSLVLIVLVVSSQVLVQDIAASFVFSVSV